MSQNQKSSKILLIWTKHHSSNLRKVSMNVVREVCSYLNTPYLPGIHDNTLSLYNLTGKLIKTVSLSHHFTDGAMYCLTDENTVLCMGGYPNTTDVFKFSTNGEDFVQLPAMLAPRSWFGIWKTGKCVYAFGSHPGLASCEKFSLGDKVWTPLPDMMKPRHAFTPCEFRQDLYLPDTYQEHKVLERFNLDTELFQTVGISLAPLEGISLAFIVEGELFMVTGYKQLGRWQIGGSESELRVSTAEVAAPYPVSSCPTVQFGREILGIYYLTGRVMKFDLDTKQLTID